MSEARALDYLDELMNRYPALAHCREPLHATYTAIAKSFASGGKLLVCGNGGSAADADHIVGELLKGFRSPRPLDAALKTRLHECLDEPGDLPERLQGSFPAIALSAQSAIVTAVLNDQGADCIFAQQVLGYGRTGDCLLALSTSGTSRNILAALGTARALGLTTIGFTGTPGGKFPAYCDITVHAPANTTAAIQEYHLPLYHTLCSMLEAPAGAEH